MARRLGAVHCVLDGVFGRKGWSGACGIGITTIIAIAGACYLYRAGITPLPRGGIGVPHAVQSQICRVHTSVNAARMSACATEGLNFLGRKIAYVLLEVWTDLC